VNRPEGFEFFEVAAQVIPIFLLVLVFEARIFRGSIFAARFLARLAGLIFLCFVLTGEVASFIVLKNPDAADNSLYFWLVLLALFSQFWLFILIAFPKPPTQPPGTRATSRRGRS
jgi:hypothetical protein